MLAVLSLGYLYLNDFKYLAGDIHDLVRSWVHTFETFRITSLTFYSDVVIH